jgi:hypothetical protein
MTAGRRRLAAAVAGAVALLVLATGCDGGGPNGRYAGISSTTPTQAPEQEAKGLDAARGFRRHSERRAYDLLRTLRTEE